MPGTYIVPESPQPGGYFKKSMNGEGNQRKGDEKKGTYIKMIHLWNRKLAKRITGKKNMKKEGHQREKRKQTIHIKLKFENI